MDRNTPDGDVSDGELSDNSVILIDNVETIEIPDDVVPNSLVSDNVNFPIVYTTRLEDMWTFNQSLTTGNLKKLTTDQILTVVEFESKPKINKYSSYQKGNRCSLDNFNRLTKSLAKINDRLGMDKVFQSKKTNAEEVKLNKESANLLKLCKPLKIVLKDFQKYGFEKKQNNNIECPGTYGETGKNTEKEHTFCFTLKDEREDAIESYFVNGNGSVTTFLRLNHASNLTSSELLEYLGTKEVMINKFCCWKRRVQFVKSLQKVYNISDAGLKFITQCHKCPHNHCLCCCNAEEIPRNLIYNTKQKLNEHVRYETEMTKEMTHTISEMKNSFNQLFVRNENDKSDSLIVQALKYNSQAVQKPNKVKTNIKFKNVVEPNVTHIVFKHLKIGNPEFYSTDRSGKLLYFEMNPFLKGYSDSKTGCMAVRRFCCWAKRQKHIEDFSTKAFNMDSHLINFLKKPHRCPPLECSCCCREIRKANIPIISTLILSERAKHTQGFTGIRRLNTSVQSKSAKYSINRAICNTIAPRRQEIVTKKLPVSSKQKICNVAPIQRAANKALPSATVQKINQSSMPPPLMPIKAQDSIMCATPSGLKTNSKISTTLDKFQDMRLTINKDGKVAAALTMPVNTLSNAELKVLASILSHAQKQVKVLGLGPGSYSKSEIGLQGNIPSTNLETELQTKTLPENVNKTTTANNSSQDVATIFPEVNNKNITSGRVETGKIKKKIRSDGIEGFENYSKMLMYQNESYISSFKNYVGLHESEAMMPVIENVYSLTETNSNANKSFTSSIDMRESNIDKKEDNENIKRKAIDNPSSIKSKIRVLSPTKLIPSGNINVLHTFPKSDVTTNETKTSTLQQSNILKHYSAQSTQIPKVTQEKLLNVEPVSNMPQMLLDGTTGIQFMGPLVDNNIILMQQGGHITPYIITTGTETQQKNVEGVKHSMSVQSSIPLTSASTSKQFAPSTITSNIERTTKMLPSNHVTVINTHLASFPLFRPNSGNIVAMPTYERQRFKPNAVQVMSIEGLERVDGNIKLVPAAENNVKSGRSGVESATTSTQFIKIAPATEKYKKSSEKILREIEEDSCSDKQINEDTPENRELGISSTMDEEQVSDPESDEHIEETEAGNDDEECILGV